MADQGIKIEDQTPVETESGKFRQLLGILRQTLSVKDLTSVRLSLPAHLLEPVGNLEYWQYCERPDFFASLSEKDDELERMLDVVRWTFTKDLRFVKLHILKPYNSVLGEHFHCHYKCIPVDYTAEQEPIIYENIDEDPSPEVLSAAGRKAKPELPKVSAEKPEGEKTTVAFLTEQTSHHPPVSFFYIEARGPKGRVIARGADQLSARFTGAAIKICPGNLNKGIFVSLPDRNEEYHIAHPIGSVTGLLRGSLFATITEHTQITCLNTKYRALLAYIDEPWLSKPKFLVEGCIYEHTDNAEEEQYTRLKLVPKSKIAVVFKGSWRGEIRYCRGSDFDEKSSKILVDMVPLQRALKHVAPIEEQHEMESRKVWHDVTQAIIAKDFKTAADEKQKVEQAQRDLAESLKERGGKHQPLYFDLEDENWDGRPVLTEEGRKSIEKEFSA